MLERISRYQTDPYLAVTRCQKVSEIRKGEKEKQEHTTAAMKEYQKFSKSHMVTSEEELAENVIRRSLEEIAKLIVLGLYVTNEERVYLRGENPVLFMQAIAACRLRQKMEEDLLFSKSETAKAQVISEGINLGMTLGNNQMESASKEKKMLVAELYMTAIYEALKKDKTSKDSFKDEMKETIGCVFGL